jgi:hypothetical protein
VLEEFVVAEAVLVAIVDEVLYEEVSGGAGVSVEGLGIRGSRSKQAVCLT